MNAKILVVDDDNEILELLKFTLDSEGYETITASDGLEGIEKAQSEHPDLVILDINMPKLSGYEVCEKLRESSSTCLVPIIMLTSAQKIKDRITGIKLGADEYMAKPFEPIEIVARVEGLLKRTRESLAASPLTGFPGNPSIEKEIRRRFESNQPHCVLYVDLDHFKAFNDKYGFERGDVVIKLLAVLIRTAVSDSGSREDFLGHIGGDDFIVVTTNDKAVSIAQKIIQSFDSFIINQYDQESKLRGHIKGIDRNGAEAVFPIMTVSIGITDVLSGKYQHYSQVVERAKEMLLKAKAEKRSSFVMG